MKSFFTPDFFANNRQRLRASVQHAPIVITANGNMQRAGDEAHAFVQDSNFWYLTGLSEADLVLVITETDEFLIAPTLSLERQVFDGAYDIAGLTSRSGVRTVLDERQGWQRVRQELRRVQTVATLAAAPSFMPRHQLYTLPYRRRLITKLKRMEPGIVVQDIRTILADMRCTKQPAELQALQRAIDITAETLREVTQDNRLRETTWEYELEAAISYGFRSRGASGHAFAPIVGAGRHSTTLHHANNEGRIGAQDVIVLDVGACVEHYAADITRTVSRTSFTPRQYAVFEAVARVQKYALGLLKPGVLLQDYERAVAQRMGEELVGLGLVTTPSFKTTRTYFPHATSHFLGLDTHDVGDYMQPLAENMVLTCEPGIYIPEENIGIRLEDDVLITPAGNQVLSHACPQTISLVQ